jgi:cytoskeletal protein CcmA (bactofilin family)
VIVVEEGVLFEGHCRMTQAHQPAENAPSAPGHAPPPARDLSVVALKR